MANPLQEATGRRRDLAPFSLPIMRAYHGLGIARWGAACVVDVCPVVHDLPVAHVFSLSVRE